MTIAIIVHTHCRLVLSSLSRKETLRLAEASFFADGPDALPDA